MCSIDKDTKRFLQFFVDEYIKKLILLHKVFNVEYTIIVKYMDPPRKFTIEKFHHCKTFIDEYTNILESYFDSNTAYLCVHDVMDIIKLFFGGQEEHNKIVRISKKIHNPHLIKGYTKLNKFYSNFFPTNNELCVNSHYYCVKWFTEFNFNEYESTFYRLRYENYNWTLSKL